MSGVEEMVTNLIVDQQAMAKSFQERGDRHSGSLGCHRTELEAARREINRLQANQATIVDECLVLRTQVESMGDNLCRFEILKGSLDDHQQNLALGAVSVVASTSGEKEAWSTATRDLKDPITLPS